ncbi:hypothetical protein [Actinomadura sp. B10D3]|uniref:hypothetical protein n=1 Tax=Actinomadura sp. B10D3 TaxID=3153557 RepID=UPI00325D1982
MKLRIGRVLAGTMALAAAAIMATGGTASADEPPGGIVWDHKWSATGIRVYVEEHGDIVSICDSSANGHSAKAYVSAYYGGHHNPSQEYFMKAANGYGSCKTHRASEGGVYNLPEGAAWEIAINYDGDGDGNYAQRRFINDH